MQNFRINSDVSVLKSNKKYTGKIGKVIDEYTVVYNGIKKKFYFVMFDDIISIEGIAAEHLRAVPQQLQFQFGRENLTNGVFIKFNNGGFTEHGTVLYCTPAGVQIKNRVTGDVCMVDYIDITYIGES